MHAEFQTRHGGKEGLVKSWASILDPATQMQAEMISRSNIVAGHLALMPDAHLGIGATVGSVIPQKGGIIPAAVGVDLGCGMIAVHTDLRRGLITEDMARRILGQIRERIPAGVGKGQPETVEAAHRFFGDNGDPVDATPKLIEKGHQQFGTLGSGNHFAEVCQDLNGEVWMIVHSGSRGIGNELAMWHIKRAAALCKDQGVGVEHRDLSYLQQGTEPFEEYVLDMLWAQRYAWAQREEMMRQMQEALASEASFNVLATVHCHHNYTEKQPDGTWLSRKGAINAEPGKWGIIPGSMGAETHIVTGLGNRESYCSSPHGAGRMMARGKAKRDLSLEEFKAQMQGITWNDRDAQALLDEAPFAYKPIRQVMEDAKDLVHTETVLKQFINYKGL